MKTRILKGLSEEDKSELKAQHLGCARLRKHLIKLLDEDIDALRADMRNEEHYQSPNWPLIQADRIAQEKAIKKVMSLLE